MVEYLSNKFVGLFVDFLPIHCGCLHRGAEWHVNMSLQDWVLAAFLLILGSLAFSDRSGLRPCFLPVN